MYKDKVVISVVAFIVLSAIMFGSIMAYQIYKSPMYVNNIDEAIIAIKIQQHIFYISEVTHHV